MLSGHTMHCTVLASDVDCIVREITEHVFGLQCLPIDISLDQRFEVDLSLRTCKTLPISCHPSGITLAPLATYLVYRGFASLYKSNQSGHRHPIQDHFLPLGG